MKNLMIIVLCVLSAQMVQGQQEDGYSLRINVTGIKKVSGKIGLCLITDKSEFLSDCSYYREFEVEGKTLAIELKDIKANTYAVTIYHDANSNGELDTNFIGLPKERYGFSNNPSTRFGPPGFSKCLFTVDKNTQIEMRLR